MCIGFYENSICLQSINGPYITLVPKVQNPATVNDFRPISLLNSSIKIITKILANILQKVILQLIHQNQYGFLKSRSIQDCLAWSFEYLHLCHKSRKQMVPLKLEFEKAFDKVEHKAILQVMKQKGFPERWMQWIQGILNSGTSSVLLNGTPGKVFHYRRGVRQGDPLSLLLFILVVDLLQSILNKAKDNGILRLPLHVGYTTDFSIIQYVDDTLLIMKACPQQLFVLKAILNTFAASTRLKVNYAKSNMVPINVPPDRLKHLAATFNCRVGVFPFTYLGLPLSLQKPTVQDCMPMVTRIERRLVNTSNFLTQAGKLQLVNSILSSMATFYLCSIKVPIEILNQIDKYIRHCVWNGGDINGRKDSLVARKKVTRPKMKGGLGVIKLRVQNEALLVKKSS
jgi:hypothetical protein